MASLHSLSIESKPSNAGYVAKIKATPHGEIKLVPGHTPDSQYGEVEVAWYPDGLKLTIPHMAPACITQAYLSGSGRDIIVEIKPMPETSDD